VDAPAGRRNGYGKPRQLRLTAGTITVRRSRVRGLAERFVSRVLPLFKRRTREVGGLLPTLYLHGLALGDFDPALRGLLRDAAPLSAASLTRLKTNWQLAYEAWQQRRLDDLEVVDMWADGLYVKAGLEDTKAALLVLIRALTDGRKVVLAVESGQRESKESWGGRCCETCAPVDCGPGDIRLPMGMWASGRPWASSNRPLPSNAAGTIGSRMCWMLYLRSTRRELGPYDAPCHMPTRRSRASNYGRNLTCVTAHWPRKRWSVWGMTGND